MNNSSAQKSYNSVIKHVSSSVETKTLKDYKQQIHFYII